MPSVGFEPTISAGERPQTYALDRTATGTGKFNVKKFYILPNILESCKELSNDCFPSTELTDRHLKSRRGVFTVR